VVKDEVSVCRVQAAQLTGSQTLL